MINLEQIVYIIPILGLTASIFYYAMVLRNQNKTRQAQLLMNLYEAYRSPELRTRINTVINQEWKDPDDFWKRYGQDTNPEAWTNWQSVAGFFHGIGVLLKKGLIDISLVEELLANIVLVSWVRMEPIVREFRDTWSFKFEGRGRSERHKMYSGFEYLYNELLKRENP
ncbi:MAG: DUF4760 domain-containing protein [Candidatus Thorarchaeota archaeon]|jgi:hypothetical protein